MARNDASPEAYQLKVTLVGTKPPIWRRLLVPAGATLDQLHRIIQIAMGWQDSHLHEFRVGRTSYGPRNPWSDDLGMSETRSERSARLYFVLGGVGSKIDYIYDFGDDWLHRITVEKVLPVDPEGRYPLCLGGKRQCPPEDCGGLPGYYNLLEALADPRHPDHRDMLEWTGGGFNQEGFSMDEVNRALRPRKLRTSA